MVHAAGHEVRFCQLCGRFHLLDAFDGKKRSCRVRLEAHNKRRRKLSAIARGLIPADGSKEGAAAAAKAATDPKGPAAKPAAGAPGPKAKPASPKKRKTAAKAKEPELPTFFDLGAADVFFPPNGMPAGLGHLFPAVTPDLQPSAPSGLQAQDSVSSGSDSFETVAHILAGDDAVQYKPLEYIAHSAMPAPAPAGGAAHLTYGLMSDALIPTGPVAPAVPAVPVGAAPMYAFNDPLTGGYLSADLAAEVALDFAL